MTWISGGNHRLAILITGSFFLVGMALLAGVNAGRGHRAAGRGRLRSRGEAGQKAPVA